MGYHSPQSGSQGGSASPVREQLPLAKAYVLSLVHTHEDANLKPSVERACRRVAEKILDGASVGQRHFEVIVCKRDRNEPDDSWHRRQVLVWDGLMALGLEDFDLHTEIIDRRQSIVLRVTY
ncbi:hypothetical protein DIPPA_05935 [Diplonema papillatum]|nr:hypothetical protein DIPPA_05935 [Diplonema papillatum]